MRAEPSPGNHPGEVPWPLVFPSSVRDETPALLLLNATGLGFPSRAPHLPDERLPLGGVEEQAPSQAFIKWPVGAIGVGAADARILGMEQSVSAIPGRP